MELKFIITIVTIAAAFAGFGISALCYVYVCRRIFKDRGKGKGSGKVAPAKNLSNGYPKMPLFKAAARDIQIVQMMQKDQYSRYADLNKSPQKSTSTGSIDDEEQTLKEGKPRRKDGYRKLDSAKSQQTFFFDESQSPYKMATEESINCTQNYYPQADVKSSTSAKHIPFSERRVHQGKFNQRIRRSVSTAEISSDVSHFLKNRFKSESDIPLSSNFDNEHRSRSPYKSTSSTLSILSPIEGQVEFRLCFNSESKILDITINRLTDISMKAVNLMGILETVRSDGNNKPRSKSYLKEHKDRSIELVTQGKTGYLVYVSLPELVYKRHTKVVYVSAHNIVFNEVFSLQGYSFEDLNQLELYIHVLAQFSNDSNPIIVGEVRIPLHQLIANQTISFMKGMAAPQTELELIQNHLKEATLGELQVVISFNPMISQLVVRIVQATSLPKISMTGNPNVSVKTSLYYSGNRVCKRRTSIHKRQKEPVFNETFHFDMSKERISDCDLLFEVRHHGPMHRTVIGYVNIGKTAQGHGANHWRQLLDYSSFENHHRIIPNKPAGLG